MRKTTLSASQRACKPWPKCTGRSNLTMTSSNQPKAVHKIFMKLIFCWKSSTGISIYWYFFVFTVMAGRVSRLVSFHCVYLFSFPTSVVKGDERNQSRWQTNSNVYSREGQWICMDCCIIQFSLSHDTIWVNVDCWSVLCHIPGRNRWQCRSCCTRCITKHSNVFLCR